MEDAGSVTKIGFDATAKLNDRVEGNERAQAPAAARAAAADWLRSHLSPVQRTWLK